MNVQRIVTRGSMIAASACFMLVALSGCPEPGDVVITVSPEQSSVEVGETTTFNAFSTDIFESISWQSSDTSIATIDATSGEALGVSPGVVKIIATGSNSGKQGSAELTVVESEEGESLAEIDALRETLGDIPEDRLDAETRDTLHQYLDAAEKALFEEDVCAAAEWVEGYVKTAQDLRKRYVESSMHDPTWAPDLIYAEGRMLQHNMLSKVAEEFTCPGYERYAIGAEAMIMKESAEGLEARFSFGAPRMWTVQHKEAGRTFTQLQIPDTPMEAGQPGLPHIPSQRKLVAIPPDSQVKSGYEARIVDRFQALPSPVQEQPADKEFVHESETEAPPEAFFADRPFVMDEKVYGGNSPWPPDPVVVTPLGKFRDLELVQVEIFGGQYNPATQTVDLYDEVKVTLAFEGKHRGFLPAHAAENPFESQLNGIAATLFNKHSVLTAELLEITLNPRLFGEEYLILTHPDFREAADDLAQWKNQKGIITNVFEVGTGSGIQDRETPEEIKDFIRNRFETSSTRASYILLLGDAEFIGPFYRQGMYGQIGTDYPYAVLNENDEPEPMTPTFAVGRIPVDTLEEAQIVVDKLIDYEQNPPGNFLNDAYYRNATIAAQFQCCRTNVNQIGTAQRTFAEVAEFVRGALMGEGYSVQRIYEATTDNAYTEDDTPRRYYDGTLLPAAIGPNSNFAWDGSRQDIIDAFDEGRFLMIHRDHGWHSGWSHPPLSSFNASGLDNAPFFPVVYSINCSSGLFDNETAPGAEGSNVNGVYFSERLLRNPTGGAVGVIGDTRVSPSWPNTALLRGLIDATWPDTVPDFGDDTAKHRLGDILNHAKAYLATQVDVAGQGTSQTAFESEMYLYHVLGDPTLEMWTSSPHRRLMLHDFKVIDITELGVLISYDYEDNAEITLYQDVKGEIRPIGRGLVEDGEVHVAFFHKPEPGLPVQVSANMANHIPASATLELDLR